MYPTYYKKLVKAVFDGKCNSWANVYCYILRWLLILWVYTGFLSKSTNLLRHRTILNYVLTNTFWDQQ